MGDAMDMMERNLNKNRELLSRDIKVNKLYDKLRSKEVISYEDYQEIDNSKIYRTDSEKASHLLDVISTKGSHGYEVFLDCLDEHYPHLYKEVTGNEPSPRTMLSSPEVGGTYSSVIDLDGVRNLSRQLDEQRRIHVSDQQAIQALREEVFKLRFINTACKTKLLNYPKLVKKNKQMDLEIKDLKEWQLNMIIKNNELEKSISKLRFERKEQKQMIDQLQQKLDDAVDMHQSQKHNWERTNSKNEQLTQDKNDLAKKLENVRREIEQVKRQSSLWSNGAFLCSVDDPAQDPIAMAESIKILRSDLAESRSQCQVYVDRLFKEQSEMENRELFFEMIKAKNDELKHMHTMVQKELDMTNSNYQVTRQELQKITADRNYAYEQRDRAQRDAKEQCKDRERLQHRLHEHLMNYKLSLYEPMPNGEREEQNDLLSAENTGIGRHRPLRVSGYSDTSGISSGHTSLAAENGSEKSVPIVTGVRSKWPLQDTQRTNQQSQHKNISDDLQGEIRPRTIPLQKQSVSTKKSHISVANAFPETEIPLSPSYSRKFQPSFSRAEQNDGDADAGETEGVTKKDVANGFASRQAHFADSTRSDWAQQGSRKEKDYHEQVDFWIMRQSFKVRPPLDMAFSIDYDDENEDLERIFADDMATMSNTSRRSNKALKRRSRSLSNLTLSSDDSDEGHTGRRPQRPQAQRTPNTRSATHQLLTKLRSFSLI